MIVERQSHFDSKWRVSYQERFSSRRSLRYVGGTTIGEYHDVLSLRRKLLFVLFAVGAVTFPADILLSVSFAEAAIDDFMLSRAAFGIVVDATIFFLLTFSLWNESQGASPISSGWQYGLAFLLCFPVGSATGILMFFSFSLHTVFMVLIVFVCLHSITDYRWSIMNTHIDEFVELIDSIVSSDENRRNMKSTTHAMVYKHVFNAVLGQAMRDHYKNMTGLKSTKYDAEVTKMCEYHQNVILKICSDNSIKSMNVNNRARTELENMDLVNDIQLQGMKMKHDWFQRHAIRTGLLGSKWKFILFLLAVGCIWFYIGYFAFVPFAADNAKVNDTERVVYIVWIVVFLPCLIIFLIETIILLFLTNNSAAEKIRRSGLEWVESVSFKQFEACCVNQTVQTLKTDKWKRNVSNVTLERVTDVKKQLEWKTEVTATLNAMFEDENIDSQWMTDIIMQYCTVTLF